MTAYSPVPSAVASSLDRGALAAQKPAPQESTIVAAAAADIASSVTVDLPLRPVRTIPPGLPRAVPDVHGMSLRAAVHALHRAGFRVELIAGAPGATIPSAGTVVPEGELVKLGRW